MLGGLEARWLGGWLARWLVGLLAMDRLSRSNMEVFGGSLETLWRVFGRFLGLGWCLGSSGGVSGSIFGGSWTDLGSILEVKIDQKSIKNAIKFQINFWKVFLMDFGLILDLFLEFCFIEIAIKVEKDDFMKNL